VSGECWVCGTAIGPEEARVPARGAPHRLRAFEGKPVHLRCHGDWDGVAPPARGPKPVERTSALVEGKRLFTEDLAAMRGISIRQARRWLVRLELRYGVTVVGRLDGRRGPRRFTTASALETVGPRWQCEDEALSARIAALEQRVTQLERSAEGVADTTGVGDAPTRRPHPRVR
jgi:hypothetical protein